MNILGISAYYHDSAASLVRDGEIIAAAQEERFTRKKHDPSFPVNAIRYCLAEGGIKDGELDAVAFYDKPILKFVRILETYLSVAPRGLQTFTGAIPVWLKQKLWIPFEIERTLMQMGFRKCPPIYFTEHHESHAASAFYPSPFETAAILTVDGVGEWATTTLGRGSGNTIELLKEMRFPHSLGLLYSAFTYFTGFKVNSGEYKLMGLSPYGEPKYVDLILKELIDLREDGSFRLNMKYFGFLDEMRMINKNFERLFGGPPRQPESEITQREIDIAASIQRVTEEIMLRMARYLYSLTGEKRLCLAGGVALNCVANSRILREGPFEEIWIQPAAGDAGGAVGSALCVWYNVRGAQRVTDGIHDFMKGALLGPGFSDSEIEEFLKARNYPYVKMSPEERPRIIAELIEQQKVIGLFQGRMEFGPRALGNRSIIGDARSPEMQSVLNLKIKYRESFRPFAPSCLREDMEEYFELRTSSPYMLLVAPVRKERRITSTLPQGISLRDKIHMVRSDIPAVTHVDFTARLQTVEEEINPEYYKIIKAFKELTGYSVIVNTSFNVRGEPIVCTPEDAYRCFMRTEMDYLVLGSFLLDKRQQPPWKEQIDWRRDYVLD